MKAMGSFEDKFLAIPDVDESLLEKLESGRYKDKDIEMYFYWYAKAWNTARRNENCEEHDFSEYGK